MATTDAPSPRPPAEVLRTRIDPAAGLRLRDLLFRAYLAALFGPVVYLAASDVVTGSAALLGVRLPLATPTAAAGVAPVLAAASAAALAATVHTGVWRGPFPLDRADLSWILASPLPRRALLLPWLRAAAARYTVVGAAAGAVAGSLTATALGGTMGAASVAGAVGGAGLGLLGLAGAWWPTIRPAQAARTLRVATAAGGVALGLGAVGLAVPAASALVLWSGPWGWVAAATAAATRGQAVPAVALLALSAGVAAVGVRAVFVTTGRGHAEGLARTTGAAAGAAAAAYMLDFTAVAEVRREALDALRPSPRLRLPAAGRPGLAIAWRDATSLLRTPGRTMAAVAAGGAGALVAAVGIAALASTPAPGAALRGPVLVAVGVVLSQAAASVLLAPLRSALTRPFGHLHLPWSHLGLVRRHLAVPITVLAVSGGVTAGVAAAAVGAPDPPAVALGAMLLAPLLVLGAALPALRPPRAPQEVAEAVLTNEYGALAFVLRSWPRFLVPATVTAVVSMVARADLPLAGRLALGLGTAGAATAAAWWRLGRKAAPWA